MKRKAIKIDTKTAVSDSSVVEALMRRAVGYTTEEITEEYAIEDGKCILVKRKIATKEYPPDLSAITVALEVISEKETKVSELSDEELLKEKERLLKALKEDESKRNKAVVEGQLSMIQEEENGD